MFVCIILIACAFLSTVLSERTFSIDYDKNCFEKDASCYRYISGSVHYFRSLHQDWENRLKSARAIGLTTVQTYIPWFIHEPFPGVFDFSGNADMLHFIALVHSLDMTLIIRPGPYIDDALDLGGLPWWLLKTKDIKLRTSDKRYLKAVKSYFDRLFPMLKPYLYENGGPIISIQVENEYGSHEACDAKYMEFLRDLYRSHFGNKTVLFTIDGNSINYLKCGTVEGVYATVDFGSITKKAVNESFDAQRKYAPKGPLVNSEFYPGISNRWKMKHQSVRTQDFIRTLESVWNCGAYFNIYMVHGGTSFGFLAGAYGQEEPFDYLPATTSFDYDAPMNESGDPTSKYFAIRQKIETLTNRPNRFPPPAIAPKGEIIGDVVPEFIGTVYDLLKYLVNSSRVHTTKNLGLSFEDINQPYGFVLYETTLTSSGSKLIIDPPFRDNLYISVNRNIGIGNYSNLGPEKSLEIACQVKLGQTLQILVENQGRRVPKRLFVDRKGLLGSVKLDGAILENWIVRPFELETLNKLLSKPGFQPRFKNPPTDISAIYFTHFAMKRDKIEDVFFDASGWKKGQVFVNNFNVGRYWPQYGPQIRLYVPKHVLKSNNTLFMMQLGSPDCHRDRQSDCKVSFEKKPLLHK